MNTDPAIERVCTYPRPPALVVCSQHIVVKALGAVLADTHTSLRVLETFHPPTFYLPADALRGDMLEPAAGGSWCEWKGMARYFDVVTADQRLPRAVWSYPRPTPNYAPLAGWFALYPALMDGCWVDGELVQPQPGGFYGGWITSAVQGPFKGDPAHPELI